MNTKKYRTIVIEDVKRELYVFLNLLKPFSNIEVIETANDVENAVAAISFHRPDLIFLDIELYGRKSFEVLDIIYKYNLNPILIFTTAHLKYEEEALKYALFKFMLKPIIQEDLKKVIDSLDETFKGHSFKESYEKFTKTIDKIPFSTIEGFTLINPKEILYIKADSGYSEIILDNGKKVIITKKIGEIETQLSDEVFYRAHRSYIINLSKIENVNRKRKTCYFRSNNKSIPLNNISCETIKKLKEKIEELIYR